VGCGLKTEKTSIAVFCPPEKYSREYCKSLFKKGIIKDHDLTYSFGAVLPTFNDFISDKPMLKQSLKKFIKQRKNDKKKKTLNKAKKKESFNEDITTSVEDDINKLKNELEESFKMDF